MRKQDIFVDIIIPNFNKANYLDECIKSVFDQNFKNWKLYIVDDCSTDNSKEIINKYLNNSKIKIYFLKKNKGPSFCRNLGIRKSSNEYISFLDSDDMWKNNKLSDQVQFMRKNNYQFTFSNYTNIYNNNSKEDVKVKKIFNLADFQMDTSINSSTMIIKRSSIGLTKFKKIDLLEDYLFKCDLLKKDITAFNTNSSLAFYRINSNSRSKSKFKNIFWLWKINRDYNNLNFIKNLILLFYSIINSLKKYGFKKY
tara:strand:- start:993 stop:1754 length:762 start_codon:yes stop_codon:yes gene_type:complete